MAAKIANLYDKKDVMSNNLCTFAPEIIKTNDKMKNFLVALLLMCGMTAEADNVMKKEKDGTYVVNTTTLAQDVDGYNGPTPLEIYIKKNKIVKVVLLKSQETPKYNARIKKQMLPQYEGMKVVKGKTPQVDGVTEATFTSDAVKENVRRGLEYYFKHK
jgi:electron transport complex protein RnfG